MVVLPRAQQAVGAVVISFNLFTFILSDEPILTAVDGNNTFRLSLT